MDELRTSPSDREIYIEAIRKLKTELGDLLGKEEGSHLKRSLGQYLRWARSPEHRDRSLTRALDRIGGYPPARLRLGQIVGEIGGEQAAARLFEPLLGEPSVVAPGDLMVCPVDPAHYRRRIQYAGQVFRCPEHNVRLVPESEVGQEVDHRD